MADEAFHVHPYPDYPVFRRTEPTPEGRRAVEMAWELVPQIRAATEEIEANKRLPDHIVKGIGDTGLWQAIGSDEVGGGKIDYTSFFEGMEALAFGDGSAGWSLLTSSAAWSLSAFMNEKGAKEVFESPYMVTAGSPGPTGRGIKVDGGYRVTGEWAWASNYQHSTRPIGGFMVWDEETDAPQIGENGMPVMWSCFFRREDTEAVEGSWNTTGLAGTFSGRYRATDAFVPDDWTFRIFGAEPQLHNNYPVRLGGHSIVAVGMARHAIEAFLDIIYSKALRMGVPGGPTPTGAPGSPNEAGTPSGPGFGAGRTLPGPTPGAGTVGQDAVGSALPQRTLGVFGDSANMQTMRDRGVIQHQLAEAEAMLRSVRCWLYEVIDSGWEDALNGKEVADDRLALSQLNNSYTARTCAEVIRKLHSASATTAIFQGNPLEKIYRDVLVLCAHMGVQENNYERTGRYLVGLDTNMRVGVL